MLFLYISLIVCYKKSFDLSPGSKQKLPSYFHFQSNGEYLIDVDTSNQKVFPITVDIYICTKSEFKKFKDKKNGFCTTNYNLLIESHDNNSKVSGTINKKGPYQILIFSSQYSDQSTVSITLRNPKSYLDYYLQPCLYIEPVFLSIFILFMILWIINTVQYSLYNFSISDINYHKILTISFIIIILTSIFRICSLWKRHHHNESKPYGIIKDMFVIIEGGIIFYSIFLSAKGMNIINEKISIQEHLNILVWSFIISIPFSISDEDELSLLDYIFTVIYLFFFIIFVFILRRMIKKTKRKLVAHLYVINEEGIDPLSTPIYEKYLLFEKISFFLMNFFCCSIVIICLLIFSCVYALNMILIDLILLSFTLPLAWFYRYRKEMKRGYMKFDEIEFKREPKKILSETVNKIDLSTFQKKGSENGFNAEKNLWSDGMPLPPCPIIVESLVGDENIDDIHLNQNNVDVDKKDDVNIENRDNDDGDDNFVPKIDLESMKDLKI